MYMIYCPHCKQDVELYHERRAWILGRVESMDADGENVETSDDKETTDDGYGTFLCGTYTHHIRRAYVIANAKEV